MSQELFAIGSLGGALAVFHAVVGDFRAIGVVAPRFEFRDAFLAGVKVNRALGRLGHFFKKEECQLFGFFAVGSHLSIFQAKKQEKNRLQKALLPAMQTLAESYSRIFFPERFPQTNC